MTQKALQDQIAHDVRDNFTDKDFASLKSSEAYQCDTHGNCQIGLQAKKERCCEGKKEGTCPYLLTKTRFERAVFSVTNYPYFLTERMYVNQLPVRNTLICDECHTIERQLLRFGELVISQEKLREWNVRGVDVPEFDDMRHYLAWLEKKYLLVIKERAATLQLMLESDPQSCKDPKVQSIVTALQNQVQKTELAVSGASTHPEDWVYWTEETEKDGRIVYLKPLVAAPYADLVRSGGLYRVYMSAYPGDKHIFCRSLGLDPKQVAWIKLKSPFAPENRPIIMGLVGSMSKRNKAQTLPVVLKTIDKVLTAHSDEKGVIHCLDEKTRVLTIEGFKGIDELRQGNLVATLNPETHALEYQPATYVTRREHRGVMVRVKTRGLNMLVTPEHRIYAVVGKNGRHSAILEARHLVTGLQVFGSKKARVFKIPKTAKWLGPSLPSYYARFLGWFCAEGCAYITTWKGKRNFKVCISQQCIEQTEIPKLVEAAGYRAWIDKGKTCDTAVITNKDLCLKLRETCYTGEPSCFTKKVPSEIKQSGPETIKEFLLALVSGDGSVRHNSAIRSERPHMQFYTSSRRLCEDVVELALKCEWSANWTLVDGSRWKPSVLNGTEVKRGTMYVVYIGSGTSTHIIHPGDATFVDNYRGEVFCPTTANGIIFVERDGKTYWTGNCNSYALGNEIYDHFVKTVHGVRLRFPRCADDREAEMAAHALDTKPSVLISPSMTEGFDFKADLARWQIVAKMPYPYLGDQQVAAMKERNPDWYALQVVQTLVQACGRIVRDETDHGVTYILDSDFTMLWDRHAHFFPPWFKQALVWPTRK